MRWTFQTLVGCVKEHIKRVTGSEDVDITQLYYKKSKSRTVVKLTGDGDIIPLLNEYPLTYKGGKRKKQTTMYLAVDLKKGLCYRLNFCYQLRLFTFESSR